MLKRRGGGSGGGGGDDSPGAGERGGDDAVLTKSLTGSLDEVQAEMIESTGAKLLGDERFVSHIPEEHEQVIFDYFVAVLRKHYAHNWAYILGRSRAQGIDQEPGVLYIEMWQECVAILRILVGGTDPVDLKDALKELDAFLDWVRGQSMRDHVSILFALISQLFTRTKIGMRKVSSRNKFDLDQEKVFAEYIKELEAREEQTKGDERAREMLTK